MIAGSHTPGGGSKESVEYTTRLTLHQEDDRQKNTVIPYIIIVIVIIIMGLIGHLYGTSYDDN